MQLLRLSFWFAICACFTVEFDVGVAFAEARPLIDPDTLIDPGREPELERQRRSSPVAVTTLVVATLGGIISLLWALGRRRRGLSHGGLVALSALFLTLLGVEAVLWSMQDSWRQHIKLRDGCYHDNPRGYFERSAFYRDSTIWAWCTDRLSLTWQVCERGSPPKTPAEVRVLALGDSFTDGVGVFRRDTWPAQLQEQVGQPGFSTINCGQASAYTAHVAKRFLSNGLSHQPDIALYAFVLNDVAPPRLQDVDGRDIAFQPPDAEVYRERLAAVPLFGALVSNSALALWASERVVSWRIHEETVEMYRATYRDLERPEVKEAFELIEAMSAVAQEREVRFAVVVWPLLESLHDYPFESEHRRIVNELTRRGLNVIDLLPAFEGSDAQELHVHPTDHHPNEVAHKRAAAHILTALDGRGWLTKPESVREAPVP